MKALWFGLLSAAFLVSNLSFNTVEGDPNLAFPDEEPGPGPALEFLPPASDSLLTILNGNLWMLPGSFAVEKQERLERFVAFVRTYRPHVVTLQEIWTTDIVDYLAKSFPEFSLFRSGHGDGFNEGGLVTLTRLPGAFEAFVPFETGEEASLIERQAKKGYLAVRIATAAFRAVIVNTHLYAPTRMQEQPLAASQFETLKRLAVDGDYFVVGDLNLSGPVFEALNASFFVTERDTAYTYDAANRYTRLGANAFGQPRYHKIDRLLLPRSRAGRFAVESLLIRTPVVSDHYLLAYRIALQAV